MMPFAVRQSCRHVDSLALIISWSNASWSWSTLASLGSLIISWINQWNNFNENLNEIKIVDLQGNSTVLELLHKIIVLEDLFCAISTNDEGKTKSGGSDQWLTKPDWRASIRYIFCTRNNKYYKWYYTDKGKTKYIPKSERKLAEQLVKRKYLESRLRKFKQEEKRIDIYLKQYSLDEFSSYHVEEHPELQKLLSGVYVPLKQELDEWVNASYTNNPKEPQKLIHKTNSRNSGPVKIWSFNHKCVIRTQNPISLWMFITDSKC